MHLEANWIWVAGDPGTAYHQSAQFQRDFELKEPTGARIAISADSFYRLKINGVWVNDGPSRSYPEHYQYDVIDLSGLVRPGRNRLEAVVRYFGCGTFHQLPRRAGFIAELLVHDCGGTVRVATDSAWQARPLSQLTANTAKVSVQQSPVEIYDATRPEAAWGPAEVLFVAGDGPWRNLEERDCALLSRVPVGLRCAIGAFRERRGRIEISWQARRIYRPGSTSNNLSDAYPTALALEVEAADAATVPFLADNLKLFLDGCQVEAPPLTLTPGRHLLLAAVRHPLAHTKDHTLVLDPAAGVTVRNPLTGRSDEYALIVAPGLVREAPDLPFLWANPAAGEHERRIVAWTDTLGRGVTDAAALRRLAGCDIWQLTAADLNASDGYWDAILRDPQPLEAGDVQDPGAVLYRDGTATRIAATPPGIGIELLYDFGEQNCGYWEFEVTAAAGTVIDLYAVEFITPEGVVQQVRDHHNVLRYICHEGRNRYCSLKRRAGRYLFVTVSDASAPVELHYLGLVESTYPVQRVGTFQCSDQSLNRIWEMSERTLKLCMEDTFTDCPLYEQTLWVGDARSEALFAFPVFGAYDLARRCIRIAGRSLEHYPIVGCQVPSSWDCLLPAWSFQWGMSVYDYYFETGDIDFVREVWPMVRQNLAGARGMIDAETGLFRLGGWNMFDWSPTDCNHEIVTYLSMFLAGALDAALQLAGVVGDAGFRSEFEPWRTELGQAIDQVWDAKRGQWPDFIENSRAAEQGAVHTSMLALLYDLTTAANRETAAANVLTPRPELFKVCSPFASLYYYMALEKLGQDALILDAIRRDYREMLKLGESTVWETYLSLDASYGFPTRSHCHGWSAAPLYFLPRTVLGLRMTQPGAARFTVAPVLLPGMDYAAGRVATIRGAVTVRWERCGDELKIRVTTPPGVDASYQAHPSHDGLRVDYQVN